MFSTYSLYLHYYCWLSDRDKTVLHPPVISVLILVGTKLMFSPSSLVVYKERGERCAGRLADSVTVTPHSSLGHRHHRGLPRQVWPGQHWTQPASQPDREVRKSAQISEIKYDAVFVVDRAGGNDAIRSPCFMIATPPSSPPPLKHFLTLIEVKLISSKIRIY